MIFIDSNVILRYLTASQEPHLQVLQRRATSLFEAASKGELTITTSEVVLHEVAYVLTSNKGYSVPRNDVADYLATIVGLPAMRLPRGEKSLLLRAIDLFRGHPSINLADAIVIARAEKQRIPLATFDKAVDRLPYAESWQFPE